MTADTVLELLTFLSARGIDVWIGGGWGVDALVGEQTRDHADLDVSIRAEDEATVVGLLEDRGFQVVTDWRPNRAALRHPSHGEVDVHPIHVRPDGSAWLPGLDDTGFEYPADGFTWGTIAGRRVPCITADLQLTFHLGYEPTSKDHADMQSLADAGLVDLPEEYEP